MEKPHAHSYTALVNEPTCTEEGFTTYTCECGNTYVADHTEPLGHDWQGTDCSRCDEKRENPFVDVPENAFYFESVLWAVENDITTGADDIHFNPGGDLLRAQFVTFLWRAAGEPEPASSVSNGFTDVVPGMWYEAPINWAVENGVTNGMGDGTFGISNPCNRAHAVTFMYRALA